MHPFSTAPTPSVRTDELALASAGEIMCVLAASNGALLTRLKAQIQCIVQRAIEAGQPARQVNDDNTDRKADEIMTRGYQLTGYVLRHPTTSDRVIIESSAVRWVKADDMAKIMFPQNRQPRQPLTDERIFRVIGTMPKDGYTLATFARAIEAEINKAKDGAE